ncbi:uroporphyrinogen decarboxylase family protein [Thermoflexus sp.]|uniref:uroporphyrinogen decarboxylase family protein n=1 Tax=Thermoflexus sp. TaxID=1969742 RepID=UPI00175A8F10|nr:uroporphyrinogen decarboxylase family protein [Thermoflexus sp.]
MEKRERLQAAIQGDAVDRPPVALWRHFPVADQDPSAFAEAVIGFQRRFDFDFVKITPASSYCVRDWGVEDRWEGDTEGTRRYIRHPVQEPRDWAALPVLDPTRGALREHLEAVARIRQALPEVPVVVTVFSPLAQAKNLAGPERLLLHLRRHPEALEMGLRTITESTRRFIRAALELGVDGIFYAVQHASYLLLSPEEYRAFGRPYDLAILEVAIDAWLNILHLHGEAVMFDLFVDYPVAVWNWHDRETPPALEEGKEKVRGAVLGGLSRIQTLVLGTPQDVEAEAREAIARTGGRRFILGTGCVVPIHAPEVNLQAARQVVERASESR